MTNLKSLNTIIIKENVIILKKNISNYLLSNNERKIIRYIIDINLIKLNIIQIKKYFFQSTFGLIKIFFKNPFIIFKLNMIKSIKKDWQFK